MSQDFGGTYDIMSHFEITERLLIQTPLELVDGAKQWNVELIKAPKRALTQSSASLLFASQRGGAFRQWQQEIIIVVVVVIKTIAIAMQV